MKHLLESMMDSELENHLQEDKASWNSSRRNGKTNNILGIEMDDRKDLIGIYSSENEGAKFWVSVTDLKQCGVEDILVACIDGLKGISEVIEAIFPKTKVQL
jgi:transposase-like protein